jgi:hypothetical protein
LSNVRCLHAGPVTLALLASLAWPAAAQRVVDFAQLDVSSDTITAVAVRALGDPRAAEPAPLLTAAFSRWEDGQAGGVGAVYRFGLPTGAHAASVGVGAGVNGWRSRAPGDADSDQGLSLRLQAESYGPAPGGHYYVLAQGSSFRDSWLATVQYDPSAWPLAFEWSRYGETGYHATTLTLRIALGDSRWSARVGAIDDDGGTRAFVGIGYNGF